MVRISHHAGRKGAGSEVGRPGSSPLLCLQLLCGQARHSSLQPHFPHLQQWSSWLAEDVAIRKQFWLWSLVATIITHLAHFSSLLPGFSASTLINLLWSILHTSANDLFKRQIALVTPLLNTFRFPITLRTKSKILNMSYKVVTWAVLFPLLCLVPHLRALAFLAVPQILNALCDLHTCWSPPRSVPPNNPTLTHSSFPAFSRHLQRSWQIRPTAWFWTPCKWRMFLHFLIVENNQKDGISYDMRKLYEIPVSESINKVLLEHSHPCLFCIFMASLVLEQQSWAAATEIVRSKKHKIFTFCYFTESLPTPPEPWEKNDLNEDDNSTYFHGVAVRIKCDVAWNVRSQDPG